ncbi:uncharacterized protein A4U43_C01F23990 [Asparagus officinalis]|uniref:Cytochrome P450 n=1 Tax=Asparagus officinalis TaxID=4686 RepID=A0A5P1FRP8_ASPOF|nr:cytochrome P450 711A1-like [Asparagus officinalis]ONK80986.1 uncharacterized protein A4U43_C01F23990 [Asparagus officinalis]
MDFLEAIWGLERLMEIRVPLIRLLGPCLLSLAIFPIGFLVYFYAPYWRVRKIPGPPTKFLLGHLPLMAKHGPDVLIPLAHKYGSMFRFHLGRQPIVIISDPELCREVGIKKFKIINNRSIRSPTTESPLHEEGIFLSRDSSWSSKRNTVVSVYQPSHLANLIPIIYSHLESLISNISSSKEDIQFSQLCTKWAIDVIGDTAFGVQFGLSNVGVTNTNDNNDDKDEETFACLSKGNSYDKDEVSEFLKLHALSIDSLKMGLGSSFSTIIGIIAPFLQVPCREILRRIPGTADYRMHDANRKLSGKLDEIIKKRVIEKTLKSKDFLAAILNARESGKEQIDNTSISALAYEHLLAGSKTTNFTLVMVVYLVSNHPEVEKKLLQEIDDALPRDVIPTADDLKFKFPYLDQVVKETMRYRTVSPVVARETSTQVEVGGYILPKGTWIWLAIGVLAKDPKQFPEPEEFKPERFDPNCDEEKQRHPYANIPFGIGPRTCVAQKFAILEIKLALIRLYRSYIFKHSPKMQSPLEYKYGLVLEFKNGVKLRAIKRDV